MDFETSISVVYVKINSGSYITEVDSSDFLMDSTGWVEIDRGYGDRFYHAQNNYFDKPIMTPGMAYQYKLVNGTPVECTSEEIAYQEESKKPVPTKPEVSVWDELDAAYQEGVDSV